MTQHGTTPRGENSRAESGLPGRAALVQKVRTWDSNDEQLTSVVVRKDENKGLSKWPVIHF